jgi:hypothetical protein
MELEWVRNVASDGDREMLFWASGGDFDAFDVALEDDRTVSVIDHTDVGGQRLYQVTLMDLGGEVGSGLYPVLLETVGFVQSLQATHEWWYCHFAFPDRDALSRFFDACRECGFDYEITRLYEWREADEGSYGLTDAQREAFVTAIEHGYFDVPRDCTLGDLADSLDISDTAVSMRLRRAIQTLAERTVCRGTDDVSP